ncbi:DUF2157 domain-containing protein [Hoeflea sp. G2-23]|uniref:DUF2157 domain-containing protein n=1 Tax=Hoeflea algicola TaxID=2983763 RepID=A0ABT3Z5Y0_9HYPH|nr:DUF2157 domain-containing protein [Hoeflea algicola]MCY0147063.1 DUF2157 domain-containing protein [Hoeflea algicola]
MTVLRRYLAREIEQWTTAGLLPPGQGAVLLADHDRRHTGFSLAAVLAVLAAILLGAAVIALVAANWELIARPMRVLMLAVLIGAGLVTAVMALRKRARWVCEAALVFSLLCFGAGIALVGQMYHLSGDDVAFMLLWTLGAIAMSLSFSSPMAAVGAGLLAFGYLSAISGAMDFGAGGVNDLTAHLSVLAIGLVIAVSAWRAGSVVAGHLVALLLICWMIWLTIDKSDVNPGYVLAAIGLAAFAVGSRLPPALAGFAARHGAVSAYGAVLLLCGVGLVQIEHDGEWIVVQLALAALILSASIVVLAIAGGHNRLIRRFAYFVFAAEVLYVVSETLGTLLGSSGFLFLGGLVLAAIAVAVMKIEKRFQTGKDQS